MPPPLPGEGLPRGRGTGDRPSPVPGSRAWRSTSLIREELGLDPDELGSRTRRGRIVRRLRGGGLRSGPALPDRRAVGLGASIVLSLVALFAVGAGVSLLTGRGCAVLGSAAGGDRRGRGGRHVSSAASSASRWPGSAVSDPVSRLRAEGSTRRPGRTGRATATAPTTTATTQGDRRRARLDRLRPAGRRQRARSRGRRSTRAARRHPPRRRGRRDGRDLLGRISRRRDSGRRAPRRRGVESRHRNRVPEGFVGGRGVGYRARRPRTTNERAPGPAQPRPKPNEGDGS